MTSYGQSPRVKKLKKNFFAFFHELSHSDSKNAIKNFWPEISPYEVTLVQDLEFFWVQNYEMSYEVLHLSCSHPLTLVCFNIFVHYLILIRWLRGIILHLQYSAGISHSMNQLLGVSSFWYVNRFWSCDLVWSSNDIKYQMMLCDESFPLDPFWSRSEDPEDSCHFLTFIFKFLFWKFKCGNDTVFRPKL